MQHSEWFKPSGFVLAVLLAEVLKVEIVELVDEDEVVRMRSG